MACRGLDHDLCPYGLYRRGVVCRGRGRRSNFYVADCGDRRFCIRRDRCGGSRLVGDVEGSVRRKSRTSRVRVGDGHGGHGLEFRHPVDGSVVVVEVSLNLNLRSKLFVGGAVVLVILYAMSICRL